MRFRFTIARKLTLGFGVLIIVVLFTSYFTYKTLEENMKVNSIITKVYNPSASHLNDLLFTITDTKMLIKHWVNEPKSDTEGKKRLIEVHNNIYPQLLKKIKPLEKQWSEKQKYTFENLLVSIDSLFNEHKLIMQQLSDFESYNNLQLTFELEPRVDDKNGEIIILTDRILDILQQMVHEQNKIVEKSNKTMDKSFARFQQRIFFTTGMLLIFVIIIAMITTRTLVKPVKNLKNIILQMGKGILPGEQIRGGTDEMGEMSNALNLLVNGLKETSKFSLEIGKGNYESNFKPLSEKDNLGNSLIMMRENLKNAAKEAELRRQENYQRNWMSQGIAKFSELLRHNNDNMQEFSQMIISNLVKYLDASVGALYILNDENKDDIFIEMVACFAYKRRKFIEKRIEVGVTIVGQCVQERETIYMTDIPNDYIRISSGLGGDNPRSLLVVPLITNDEVFGVAELASFKNIEPYQVEFVEKVGENIASTIHSVKISNNTARLLMESQDKSERLARQEEEMRQNIEEMQATQEEMLKRDEEKYAKFRQEYEERISEMQERIDELQKKLLNKDKQKYILNDNEI